MARYEFEREGEKIEVEVEWSGDGYEVRMGDQSWKFKPVTAGDGGEAGDGVSKADTAGTETDSEGEKQAKTGAGGAVLTPISGKVLEVLVALDQSVEAGDDLVKLEAMKLESVIPAPRAGRVSAIHVSAGEDVEEDQKLITLERQ